MSAPLQAQLEAVLFLADDPVTLEAMVEATQADEAAIRDALKDLDAACADASRGLVLLEVAGGWRLYTDPAVNETVERWAVSGRTGRLTQAALETLAVIAYKQPITRQEISDVRGVQADAAVRSLEQRGLIAEVGVQEGPGQAALFATTPLFLEKVGISTLDDLPPLTEWLPEEAAPDEPAVGELRSARTRVAAGEELPSSWRSGAPTDPAERGAMGEIEELSVALEDAAADAVARLRTVMASTEDADAEAEESDEEGADTDEGGPVGGDAGESEGDNLAPGGAVADGEAPQ
ncbi:MAG: SMC-Scp complex subunit ScpB [Nitriliruptorales bacterium]|nr:SMC-Scp complex subunit ScpB [Nitriliruptorales bacterium]